MTVDGTWVYGSLVEGEWVYGGSKVVYDEHASFIKSTYDDVEERVRPETVCEFTGKQDRLLHDLYEGDILTDDANGLVMVVVFDDTHGLVLQQHSDKSQMAAFVPELLENMRIVGNIHDL